MTGRSCLTSSVVWLCLNAVPSDTDLFITFQNRQTKIYLKENVKLIV